MDDHEPSEEEAHTYDRPQYLKGSLTYNRSPKSK